MQLKKYYYDYFFFLCLTSIYLIAWWMQSHLLLKDDVSWLMHLSRLVFHGGDYLRDFFETNPPLIFYLYMPMIALSQLFSLNDALALRVYVFLLSGLTIYLCYGLSKKIFTGHDRIMALLLTLSLSVILLILPLFEFGQREHLLIILTLPYLLLTAYRSQHQQPAVPFFYAIGIGLMAGIGFAIKPFFLLSFFLVEFYYLYRRHCPRFTPETLAIIVFMLLYADWVLAYYQSYFFAVIPLTAQFYYQTIGHPWSVVLFNFPNGYLSAVLVFYGRVFWETPYQSLCNILLLALLGNFFSYIAQQLFWYYHLLPVLAFALMIQVLLLGLLFLDRKKTKQQKFLPLLLGVMLLCWPLYYASNLYSLGQQDKNNFSALTTYLHEQQQNKLTYFFSARRYYLSFVNDHRHEQHYPRLEYLGWTQGYFKGMKDIPGEDFFVAMMTEDLNKNKPQLILVDQAPYKAQTLNYLNVLLKYKAFTLAWAPYHYLTTIEKPFVFKFDVYERV